MEKIVSRSFCYYAWGTTSLKKPASVLNER